MIKDICQICRKPITPQYNQTRTQFYCSKECQDKGHELKRRQRDYTPCPNCGEPKWKTSKYCKKCFGQFIRGANNKLWKGGHSFSRGYPTVLVPGSRPARHMLEHHFVWEQTHGPLPKGWEIHHINGVKTDNRLRNLVAMPDRKHERIISAMQKRIQELEALLNGQNQLV